MLPIRYALGVTVVIVLSVFGAEAPHWIISALCGVTAGYLGMHICTTAYLRGIADAYEEEGEE